jgi:hypothetical protein
VHRTGSYPARDLAVIKLTGQVIKKSSSLLEEPSGLFNPSPDGHSHAARLSRKPQDAILQQLGTTGGHHTDKPGGSFRPRHS